MIGALARKLFGSANDRRIKSYQPRVNAINALEGERRQALRRGAARPHRRIQEAARSEGKTLDDILVPAFATVREAAKRTLGQRHFDVQLIGGMVLHEGDIAEMKTGEGKTLVATLAVYLNALAGRGVHVVTVNDYLARRDAEWMGQIYSFLGLTTGVIVHGLDDAQRKEAYACDITYGTNNEYGFDYLRDNMKYRLEDMVQRPHFFAIVDEVDSILIDEARTPLIISGPLDDRTEFYNTIDSYIPKLDKADYEVDEKQRTVALTEAGMEKIEQLIRDAGLLKGDSLYDIENVSTVHHINQGLRAHTLFTRDKDYIVRDGEVVIIDEFTGRMMPGRRYSEGLHQALEAKEHQPIQPENQTLASITFQNYFRMYEKLAGMTGTAATEADEFFDIYKLEVREIPTNVAVARLDEDDEVYRTANEKYAAILAEIERANSQAAAGAGRHRVDREIRDACRIPEEERLQADRLRQPEGAGEALCRGAHRQAGKTVRGAERALPRAGSLHRRRSRRARRDHDRDQHGRPRYRHQARRLARHAHRAGDDRHRGRGREAESHRADQVGRREIPRARAEGGRDGRDRAGKGRQAGQDPDQAGRPLHHRLRAPRVAAHRQPAARPLGPSGRPGPFEILPVAGRRPDAHLRAPTGWIRCCSGSA